VLRRTREGFLHPRDLATGPRYVQR
jgi:hypothetical protein